MDQDTEPVVVRLAAVCAVLDLDVPLHAGGRTDIQHQTPAHHHRKGNEQLKGNGPSGQLVCSHDRLTLGSASSGVKLFVAASGCSRVSFYRLCRNEPLTAHSSDDMFVITTWLAGAGAAQSATTATPAAAIGFALLTAVGMLVGMWTVRRFESWAIRHTAELIAFAAGLLVSGALLHLVPGAVELVGPEKGLTWALVAFVSLYLVEAHFIPHVHARGESPLDDHQHGHAAQNVGPLVVFGLALHSIVDGVSVGAGLAAGALLGTITATLVIAHKLPVGIAAMSALYHSGVPGQRAAAVTSALAMVTPLAVMASYFVLREISNQLLGVLLSLAGGSFLYIGAADLLPEGQAHGRPINTLMFMFGVLVMVAIKLAVH